MEISLKTKEKIRNMRNARNLERVHTHTHTHTHTGIYLNRLSKIGNIRTHRTYMFFDI